MIGQLHHRGWHYLLLTALAGVLFFANLGGASLWDVDEGRNITCALEMMISGNWVIPTFNAELRVDKPALLYWLQIFSYYAFGINEFSGRLPSALAALATVFLCYELARSMFSRTTGLLAGVIVATTPMLCGAARFANPDALLNACTALSLTVFWIGLRERRWWWFVSLGAATGLGMLAKGPVGLVLPGGVVTLFLLWERRLWTVAWDRRWFLASTTFFWVAIPWYTWVGVETKAEFLRGFFLRHNLDRFGESMENHSGFPGYYLVVLLVGTAPWSIFLLASWWFGFWSAIRQPWAWTHCTGLWSSATEDVVLSSEPEAQAREICRDAPAAHRLLMCWVVVYCLFFSIAATKLPNYVLPVIVPCAIQMARFLQRWRTGMLHVPSWIVGAGVLGLAFVGVGIALGATLAGGAVEWSVLSGRAIPGLAAWAWMGLVPLTAAGLGWWFAHQRQISRYIVTVAVTAVAMVAPLAAYGSMFFNQFKAPRPLVEQVGALQLNRDIRIGCWQLQYLPSLNFYVQRTVTHIHAESDLVPFLKTPLPVFLFMPANDWQRMEPTLGGVGRVVGRHHDLYRHVDIVVVTNQIDE